MTDFRDFDAIVSVDPDAAGLDPAATPAQAPRRTAVRERAADLVDAFRYREPRATHPEPEPDLDPEPEDAPDDTATAHPDTTESRRDHPEPPAAEPDVPAVPLDRPGAAPDDDTGLSRDASLTRVGRATGVAAAPDAAPDEEPRGSRLDAWWQRQLAQPRAQRAWHWGAPLVVAVLATALRFWNLGHPWTLVFDETYYVKDAYTLWNLGYEGSWPENANTFFAGGEADVYTSDPSFIAHPPLGKWLIGLGIAVFGVEHAFAWRATTAIVGVLTVLLVMLLAKKLFRSTALAVIAGGLMAIDGNAIVMSRVSLLDGILGFVALLGFGAVLLDRAWAERRLALWQLAREQRGLGLGSGPVLWWRPWLITAGLLLGAASAVKWSGLYFLAFFAVYSVLADVMARRRAGVPNWLWGTLLRQGPASFVLTVPVAVAVYLIAWTGWFVTDGGYYRHWAEETDGAWTGGLSWVPLPLQNWWHYQDAIWDYARNERRPHPYQANPLTWLLMIRPTSMFYESYEQGVNGCTDAGGCGASITGIANPLIWWAATAAAGYLVYRLVRYKEWQVGAILVGLGAGYLPWLLYTDRTVFQFYTIAFEPYLVLALTAVIGILLGSRHDPRWRRVAGIRLVAVYAVFVVAVSVFFWPLWTGTVTPTWLIRLHYWLPTWL